MGNRDIDAVLCASLFSVEANYFVPVRVLINGEPETATYASQLDPPLSVQSIELTE